MRRAQHAFTIIELVVVIVILGILAAVALPKFVDLRDDAHTAKNSGVGGAFAAAVNIAHAKWLAGGGTAATVTLEDGTVVGIGPEGWPENDNSAAADGAITAAECAAAWSSVLQAGAPTASAAAGSDYLTTVADPLCTLTYQPDNAPLRTVVYDSNTGAVVVTP